MVKPEYQAVNNAKEQKSKIEENNNMRDISSTLYGNGPILELETWPVILTTCCLSLPTLLYFQPRSSAAQLPLSRFACAALILRFDVHPWERTEKDKVDIHLMQKLLP